MQRIVIVLGYCWVAIWAGITSAASSSEDGFSSSSPLIPITMQLRWKHQFQFAGYYAAKAKGYYRQVGLDVTIRPGAQGRDPVSEVLAGRATYGEANSELLYQRIKGDPLIALAVIFQHSPSVLLARRDSNILTPQDVIGKRVMLVGGAEDYDLLAMLAQEGVGAEQLEIIPSSYEIQDLVDGRTDLFNAYMTNEPYYLSEQGVEAHIIRPLSYGIDLYSDILFTTEAELRDNPERVKAFRAATLRGWEYAMANKAEIIDLILQHYSSEKSRSHLEYEAAVMHELIQPELIEIGHINPGRFRHMADLFVQAGMVEAGYSLDGFIYDPDPRPDLSWIWPLVGSVLLALIMITSVVTYLWRLNQRLATEVVRRSLIEKRLRYSEQHSRRIINELQDVYYRTDTKGIVRDVSPSIESVLGYSAHEVVGTEIANYYLPPFTRQSFLQALEEAGGAIRNYEFKARAKDGSELWVSVNSHLLRDDSSELMGIEGTIHDVTEVKRYQEYFEHLALMDPLTHLPNRRNLLQILKKSISTNRRHHQCGALLFIDLDRFKPVNDQFGHAVGDALLQAVATRFTYFLRAEDTAARIGGDEFIILLTQLDSDEMLALEEARSVAEKSIAYLEQPFDIEGHIIEISASIGITIFPQGDLDGDELLKQADRAMYAAKERGRHCVMASSEIAHHPVGLSLPPL